MRRAERAQKTDGSGGTTDHPIHDSRVERRAKGRIRRNRRVIGLATVLLLAPVVWSYGRTLAAAGSENWSTRSVEWIKNHGGRGLVVHIESWWYSHHKPPVGGEPSGGIPNVAGLGQPEVTPSASPAGPSHLDHPPDLRTIASPPLPHEGQWQPLGTRIDHVPTMFVTYVRPDTIHTSLLTTVVWMDTKFVQPVLYAGTQLPGGSSWKHYREIPKGARQDLVAAFNSGFALKDTVGGWYSDGRTARPLERGAATLVIYRNGRVNVGQWGRDVRMTHDVVSARQNLSLLVDGGHPVRGLANENFRLWGATFGGGVLVWRSGVGVDANGGLIYVAGPGLSAYSLAQVLSRAGAVRAMELDINHSWMTFDWFKPAPGSNLLVKATKLLDNPYRSAERYLIPEERDFVAIFVRPELRAVLPR